MTDGKLIKDIILGIIMEVKIIWLMWF